MNAFRARKKKPWWWRVPASMAFQRYGIAALMGWGMVAYLAFQEPTIEWTRLLALGSLLTGAAALSLLLAIVMGRGERAVLRPFRQPRRRF